MSQTAKIIPYKVNEYNYAPKTGNFCKMFGKTIPM